MIRTAIAIVAVLVFNSSQESRPPEPLLTLGKQQLDAGDFEAAVFTLDRLVRKLTLEPLREKDLTRGYVLLGAAYVGLAQEQTAKGKFRKALEIDPALRLSPEEFSARVIKVFETEVLAKTAARQKRGEMRWLLAGGAAAAGAVGVAAASRGGSPPPAPNEPPTGTVTVTPPGQAIVGVTNMTFTAAGNDPNRDPLTYEWNFGDGSTGAGATASHLYTTEGTFSIALTIRDGKGGTGSAGASVQVRSLSGVWDEGTNGGGRRDTYTRCLVPFVQRGTAFTAVEPCRDSTIESYEGILSHPRNVVFRMFVSSRTGDNERWVDCQGEVDLALNVIVSRNSTGNRCDLVRQ